MNEGRSFSPELIQELKALPVEEAYDTYKTLLIYAVIHEKSASFMNLVNYYAEAYLAKSAADATAKEDLAKSLLFHMFGEVHEEDPGGVMHDILSEIKTTATDINIVLLSVVKNFFRTIDVYGLAESEVSTPDIIDDEELDTPVPATPNPELDAYLEKEQVHLTGNTHHPDHYDHAVTV